jgi:hypothetical protein
MAIAKAITYRTSAITNASPITNRKSPVDPRPSR